MAAIELVDRVAQEMDRGEIPSHIFFGPFESFRHVESLILVDKLNFYVIKNSLQLIESFKSITLCRGQRY